MKRTVKLGNHEGISVQLIDLAYMYNYGLPREKALANSILEIVNVYEINKINQKEWVTFYHYGLPEYFSNIDWILDEKEIKDLDSKEIINLYNSKIKKFLGIWSYKYGYEQSFITRIKNLLHDDSDFLDKIISLLNTRLTSKQKYLLETIGECYTKKLEEEKKLLGVVEIYKLVKKR